MTNPNREETDDEFEVRHHEEYRRKEERTLAEQKEDDAKLTLEQLEEARDNLAETLKSLAEALACEITAVDDCFDEEQEQAMIEQVRDDGDDEPFTDSFVGEVETISNDFPIYLRQWTEAVNAVIRRKAQMIGNGAPSLEVVK